MNALKRIVGKTVLVAVAAVGITAALAATSSGSGDCPSGQYVCAKKSSWFHTKLTCCVVGQNCCPAIVCVDVGATRARRISESCMQPGTPCPSC